ncbi:MAG: hypothetical protein ACE5R6_04290 [Candidatus Heimdallarchaeota archaeon]
MKHTGSDSNSKKIGQKSIDQAELKAAAKDFDLLTTLRQLSDFEDDLGVPVHEIQYAMRQEFELEKLPPRTSVYTKIQRLKSANLVREKIRRIPQKELSRYRGWRVKHDKNTKEIKVANNGTIEVKYGYELTPRGEDVVSILEKHLDLRKSKKDEKIIGKHHTDIR